MSFSIFDIENPEVRKRIRTLSGLAEFDKEFRARVLSEPEAVFDEIGLTVPEGWKVVVREDEPGTVSYTLPPFHGET